MGTPSKPDAHIQDRTDEGGPTAEQEAFPNGLPEEAERLVAELRGQADWSFAVTAWWVATRDLDRTARYLSHSAGWEWDPRGQGAGSILAQLRRMEGAVEANPGPAIIAAARNGQLKVTGLFNGQGSRVLIPAEEWEYLKLADASTEMAKEVLPMATGACAFRASPQQVAISGFWAQLMVARDSTLHAFPHPTAAQWKPLIERGLKNWSCSREAEAAAVAQGATSEAQICKRLAEVWREGTNLPANNETIAKYRRDDRAANRAASARIF